MPSLTVIGRNPIDDGQVEFRISSALVDRFQRYGPRHKFFELLLIEPVMMNPTAVFLGLKREEQGEGSYHCGVPKNYFIDHDITAPFPAGMIFAVFATCDNLIFEWRMEKQDQKRAGFPINWQERFNAKLWPV